VCDEGYHACWQELRTCADWNVGSLVAVDEIGRMLNGLIVSLEPENDYEL
jgi:hypothetical protein